MKNVNRTFWFNLKEESHNYCDKKTCVYTLNNLSYLNALVNETYVRSLAVLTRINDKVLFLFSRFRAHTKRLRSAGLADNIITVTGVLVVTD